jgi:hypothetical protein
MRLVAVVRDLCLAFLVGGLGAVFIAAIILFDRAPSREVAGEIGQALFNELGPVVFIVTLFLLGGYVLLRRTEPSPATGVVSLVLAGACVLIAALIALWLTPRMDVIWETAPHAEDGSGLAGEERTRFMTLHGIASASYLSIWLAGIALLVLRSFGSKTGL